MSTEPAPARRRSRAWPGITQPALAVGAAAVAVLCALMLIGRLDPVAGVGALLAVVAASAIVMRVASPARAGAAARANTDLDTEAARFFDALTEPCLVINGKAVLVHANRAAHGRFSRLRAGDPLAFTLRDPDLVEAIDTARRSGEVQKVEIHLSVPNDTWFRAAIVPYAASAGGTPGLFVVTLYDFTEQRRTDRMRTDFIANASHELRTPLTSLMGFIDTLQGPAAKDQQARDRFLAIMRTQAERMSALIEDLLSLSRIELRQHVRPTTEVRLDMLLREVAESLEPRLQEAGIALELDIPEEGLSVTADRQELFEVIENLADNAIKYGGSGGTIEIALTPGANRAGTFHALTVTDHGPGIAEEHVPRLTERFYRVESETGNKKGTGLGLAIVKHIVHRHHGEMTIRSRLGEGTRVEVLLPRRS